MGPQPHRLDGRLDRAVGGDDEDQGLRPLVLDAPDQVDPGAAARHLQVGDDQLVVAAPEQVQASAASLAVEISYDSPARARASPDRMFGSSSTIRMRKSSVAHGWPSLPFGSSTGRVIENVVPRGRSGSRCGRRAGGPASRAGPGPCRSRAPWWRNRAGRCGPGSPAGCPARCRAPITRSSPSSTGAPQDQVAPLGHRLQGVDHQVEDGLLDLLRVERHRRQGPLRRAGSSRRTPCWAACGPDQPDDVLEHLLHVGRPEIGGAAGWRSRGSSSRTPLSRRTSVFRTPISSSGPARRRGRRRAAPRAAGRGCSGPSSGS